MVCTQSLFTLTTPMCRCSILTLWEFFIISGCYPLANSNTVCQRNTHALMQACILSNITLNVTSFYSTAKWGVYAYFAHLGATNCNVRTVDRCFLSKMFKQWWNLLTNGTFCRLFARNYDEIYIRTHL